VKQQKVDRAPAARCYRCGSTEIFSLCHHCGKPMCKKDSPPAFHEGMKLVSDPTPRPASREFAWLKLKDTSPRQAAVYHCAEHEHGVGMFGDAKKAARDPASQPPLPLFPQINSIDVVERLTGQIGFDGQRYSSQAPSPVTGEIAIEMSLSDAGRALTLYKDEFRKPKFKLPEDLPIGLNAGFAMIKGKAGLSVDDGQDLALPGGLGLSFSAKSIVGHPLFGHTPGRPPGEWRISVGYKVTADRSPKEIPLWIVPSITPSSDRRTLEIDLHWNQLDADGRKLNLTRFDLIEIVIPVGWGEVQNVDLQSDASPRPTIAQGKDGRTIRWERVRQGGRKSITLQLRFENQILPDPDDRPEETPDPTFSGTVKAVFGETLSGIEGIDIYLPGGRRAYEGQQTQASPGPVGRAQASQEQAGRAQRGPEAKVRTEVTVSFDISLAALRYQNDWAVPDDSKRRDARLQAQGRDSGGFGDLRSETRPFAGVVPDHRLVTDLTNLISAEDYYVKSVVEHLPYRDDGRGNVLNRVWDIAGRWYEGVFPVDFDINLRGEELGEDDPTGSIGKTIAQVTAKGSYVNDPDLAQRAMIETAWKRLHDHVTGLLDSRAISGNGPRAIAPGGGGRSGDPRQDPFTPADDVYGDGFDRDVVVVDAEIVETEAAQTVKTQPVVVEPSDGRRERVAELRKKQDDADDAVMAGRISEDLHRRIIERIEAELRELEE
jgi:hypothetical protein